MNTPQEKYARTHAYYALFAQEYIDRTLCVDMASLREKLTSRLAEGAHVLDAGCGSGRDSKAFLDAGFQVTAFDACAALADFASKHIGQPVQAQSFQDVQWTDRFDGVFANASLLHLYDADLHDALSRLVASLKPGGVLVATFKHGSQTRIETATGRLFNDMDSARAQQFMTKAGAVYEVDYLEIDKLGRGNDWLYVVARRPA